MDAAKRSYDDLGGGWSQQVTTDDGRTLFVIVKRGRYVGKHFGNRGFKWNGFVYEDGRQLFAISDVGKNVGLKYLIDCAVHESHGGGV